jgi:hypothetical protein
VKPREIVGVDRYNKYAISPNTHKITVLSYLLPSYLLFLLYQKEINNV